jgi:hypothetical protein
MKNMIRQSGFTREEFCTGVMNKKSITVPAIAASIAPEKSN